MLVATVLVATVGWGGQRTVPEREGKFESKRGVSYHYISSPGRPGF